MEVKQPIAKRALFGSIANGLSFIFTFLQSVVLVPIFLNIWGSEKYGLWIALYSFITLVKTIDLGHQNYVGNEINKVFETNIPRVKEILGSSFKVAYLLGLIELVAGCGVFYFFSDSLLGAKLNGNNQNPHLFWATFSFLFVWFLFGSVSGILARILISIGSFSRYTYWGLAMRLLETVVLLLAAFNNLSIFYTALLLAVSSGLYYIIQFVDLKSHTKQFYPWWQSGSFKTGFKNLGKAQLLTLTGFIDQFSNSFQLISVSNYLGTQVLPVFSTLKTLTNIALQVVNIFSSPLSIDIVRYYIQKEKEKLSEIFSVIWLITLVFLYTPFILLTPYVKEIYLIWTRHKLQFDQNLYYLLALSVCVYSFGTPFRILLFGINHIRALLMISVARLIVLAAIPLGIRTYGLVAVGVAILSAEIVSSVIIPFVFIKNEFKGMGGKLGRRVTALSLSPVLVLAFFFFQLESNSFIRNYSMITAVLFTTVLLCIAFFHFKSLHSDTKSRINDSFLKRFKL